MNIYFLIAIKEKQRQQYIRWAARLWNKWQKNPRENIRLLLQKHLLKGAELGVEIEAYKSILRRFRPLPKFPKGGHTGVSGVVNDGSPEYIQAMGRVERIKPSSLCNINFTPVNCDCNGNPIPVPNPELLSQMLKPYNDGEI